MHALALHPDGSVSAAGESVDAALSANRQMQVARIAANGTMAAYGAGGFARSRVAGGSNTGQAIVVQGDAAIVGGSANLAGKTAFGLTRFTAAGARDVSFGTQGETTTPFGTPAVNGYITGMALSGNLLSVAGRLTDAAGLVVTPRATTPRARRRRPPPPPAASTLGVDQITATGARVTGTVNANGTAASWWLEYGPTTTYGSKTAAQGLAGNHQRRRRRRRRPGLSDGTLYHARLVISNGIGTTPGDDVTFTTLGAGGGPRRARQGRQADLQGAEGRRQEGQPRAQEGLASGCKVKLVYKDSKRPKGIVLKQSRKAGKKLVYQAVVKLTIAEKPAQEEG